MSEKKYYTIESELAIKYQEIFPDITMEAAAGCVNNIYESIWEEFEPARPTLTEEQELKFNELLEAITADVATHKDEPVLGETSNEEIE